MPGHEGVVVVLFPLREKLFSEAERSGRVRTMRVGGRLARVALVDHPGVNRHRGLYVDRKRVLLTASKRHLPPEHRDKVAYHELVEAETRSHAYAKAREYELARSQGPARFGRYLAWLGTAWRAPGMPVEDLHTLAVRKEHRPDLIYSFASHRNSAMRRELAEVLRFAPSTPTALHALLKLYTDRSPEVCRWADISLRAHGKTAIPYIERLMFHRNPEVVRRALFTLSYTKAEAPRILEVGFAHPIMKVVQGAIQAAAFMARRNRRNLIPLIRLLHDRRLVVKLDVLNELRMLITVQPRLRREIYERAASKARKLLTSRDELLRAGAARLLFMAGNRRDQMRLEQMLSQERSSYVRDQLASALNMRRELKIRPIIPRGRNRP